jgi:hypothetical protein
MQITPGPLTRIPPQAGPEAYQTYSVHRPRTPAYTVQATCAEADCGAHQFGWQTIVDESTDLGQRQAAWIRGDRTRHATEDRPDTGLTVFSFAPGQTCFAAPHTVSNDRPPLYLVDGGDWRGNPRGTPRRVHSRPQDWVEDFAGHQARLAEIIKEG